MYHHMYSFCESRGRHFWTRCTFGSKVYSPQPMRLSRRTPHSTFPFGFGYRKVPFGQGNGEGTILYTHNTGAFPLDPKDISGKV